MKSTHESNKNSPLVLSWKRVTLSLGSHIVAIDRQTVGSERMETLEW